MLYGIAATRIEFLGVEPNARYDIALVLPHEEDEAMLLARLQAALERDLQWVISKVTASRPVYVVTAPNGPGPELVFSGTPFGVSIATSTAIALPDAVIPSTQELQEMTETKGNGHICRLFLDVERNRRRFVLDLGDQSGPACDR